MFRQFFFCSSVSNTAAMKLHLSSPCYNC